MGVRKQQVFAGGMRIGFQRGPNFPNAEKKLLKGNLFSLPKKILIGTESNLINRFRRSNLNFEYHLDD